MFGKTKKDAPPEKKPIALNASGNPGKQTTQPTPREKAKEDKDKDKKKKKRKNLM